MRTILILSVFFIACNGNSSTDSAPTAFPAEKIDLKQLPKNLKYRGDADEAWKWKDSLGENILLLTSHSYEDTIEAGTTFELFAYQYCKKDTAYKILWRLNDIVDKCDLDWVAEFIDGSTSITDLDNDGIAETTVQYKLACHGDVSPPYMKLIMHEDSVKYALRGSMWINYPDPKFTITEKDVNLETLPDNKGTDEDSDKTYGRYETEKDFKKAPPVFLTFARRQWLKYVKHSFE